MPVEFHPNPETLEWIADRLRSYGAGVVLREGDPGRGARFYANRTEGGRGPFVDWSIEIIEGERPGDRFRYEEAQRLLALLEHLVDVGFLDRGEPIEWGDDDYWPDGEG